MLIKTAFIFYLYLYFFKFQLSHHILLWCLMAGWIGVSIASFAGVLVYRLPKSAGWVTSKDTEEKVSLMKASHCEHCKKKIKSIYLIPIIGYILSKGKCSHCHTNVSKQYPIIESIILVLSVSTAYYFGVHLITIWLLSVLWLGLIISWIDWKVLWIPDRFAIPLLFLGLMYSPFDTSLHNRVAGFIFGVCIFALVSWIVSLIKKQNFVAGGDMTLIGMGGAIVGVHNLPLFLGLSCVAYCLLHFFCYIIKFKWKSEYPELQDMIGEARILPMGPALIFGLLITMMCIAHQIIFH